MHKVGLYTRWACTQGGLEVGLFTRWTRKDRLIHRFASYMRCVCVRWSPHALGGLLHKLG